MLSQKLQAFADASKPPGNPSWLPKSPWHSPLPLVAPQLSAAPSVPAYEQPTRQTNGAAARCPGPRCAGEPRQAGYCRPACPGKSRVFVGMVVRVFVTATAMEEILHLPEPEPSPLPLQHRRSHRGKGFIKMLHFVPLKWRGAGFTERPHMEPILTSHRSPQEKALDKHDFKQLICSTLQLS